MIKNIINKIKSAIFKDDIVTKINTKAYQTTNDEMSCGYCPDVC